MKTQAFAALLLATVIATSAGCTQDTAAQSRAPAATAKSVVLLNLVGNGKDDPQALDMGMKLAGFALEEGRDVVLFFNVKGAEVPTNAFPQDLAFKDKPIVEQLKDLMQRGAEVHVCPVCMQALGIEASDLVEGAMVTTRPKLFAKIGPDTAVFTY